MNDIYRFLTLIFVASLTACGSGTVSNNDEAARKRFAGGIYKIGTPYKIEGEWYHPRENTRYDSTGVASWYGKKFHGRRTANGEIFDMHLLTAAHPTLPMPVRARVTNLENGRTVILRINDRGPFAKDREIDLSRAAAQKLGFFDKGTARVRVQYLERAPMYNARGQLIYGEEKDDLIYKSEIRDTPIPTPPTESVASMESGYAIQLGVFRDQANAQNLREAVARFGYAYIVEIGAGADLLYAVRIDGGKHNAPAQTRFAELKANGYPSAIFILPQNGLNARRR